MIDIYRPIDKPYLKQWQERMAAKPEKPVSKKHKGRKKGKRAPAR